MQNYFFWHLFTLNKEYNGQYLKIPVKSGINPMSPRYLRLPSKIKSNDKIAIPKIIRMTRSTVPMLLHIKMDPLTVFSFIVNKRGTFFL